MYLKHKTPFNEKPRGSRKEKSAEKTTDAPKPECLKFTFDNQGNLKDILTKEYGWVSIRVINKWRLLKVQALLVEKGAGDSAAYKGVWAEIERRITLGEIIVSDTTTKDVAA